MGGFKEVKKKSAGDDKARATLAIKEAAQILGIGKNQAYAAARNGDLPVLRIGGRLLVSRAALEKLLQAPMVPPAANLR